MTLESNAWAAVRRVLAPYGCLRRVENRIEAGFPDAVYTLLGVGGALETKSLAEISAEQILWAEAWTAPPALGLWHAIRREPKGGWGLYDLRAAWRWHRHETIEGEGYVWTERLKAPSLLVHLAPRERRPPGGTWAG